MPAPLRSPSLLIRMRAVALLSGGLDSATSMAMWLAQGDQVSLCLTADYGQRSAAMEATVAQSLARRYALEWQGLQLPWLGQVAAGAGSALLPGGEELPQPKAGSLGDEQSAAQVWVPARNVVLLAAAAAYAESLQAQAVLVGFNLEEAQHFPDNSEAFLQAMEAALAWGTRNQVKVVSPTLGMDKPQIAAAARDLGLQPDELWSCYAAGPKPCGSCESCLRSQRAWQLSS